MLTLGIRKITSKVVFRGFFSTAATDPVQEALLTEKCYLVDENDKIIGLASKRDCHIIQKNGHLPLHRAFSVFLFNTRGDLLFQKRSENKITYPDLYTNTCCSHPVADFPGEDEEENAMGVKKAAKRRLNYELGIPLEEIALENLNYITRIHYKDQGDGKWGEHEIAYVLFFQQDVKLKPNRNEISQISFVPRRELDEYTSTLKGRMTPWFQLYLKNRLRFWWDNLDNLDKVKDHKNILRW